MHRCSLTVRLLRLVALVSLAFGAIACSREVQHIPLDPQEFQTTTLTEIHPHRFWGDEAPENLEEKIQANATLLRQRFPDAVNAVAATAPVNRLLAISGGGADGAFGAGLLAGWSESGTRVEFEVVTGVSTGAMIAPFAFLGPAYDDTIVDIYATANPDKVFELALVGGLLLGSAATDTTPLKRQIETYVTLDLINRLADERARARSLFIVTTHFDARRPVVWDIVAIAQGRDDQAVDLIRQIILASAAIPALFPPVPMEFELDGKTFTELHVDGGLSYNIFAYPAQIPVRRLNELLGLTFRREV